MKEHREKSPIPFFLQTSLSLSYLLHNSMLKELFGKALKCKNKKQEARRKNKLNRKKWKGNLLTEMGAQSKINKKEEENFEQEKLEGEYTGWQTSHPPLYVLLEIKNWKMCKMPPHPSPPPRKARNAIADSTLYHD